MKNRFMPLLAIGFITSFSPLTALADEFSRKDTVLHFDQPQVPLNSLEFDIDEELLPVPNDFRIIEASYLSNDMGERWVIITFENTSSGQRFLKNEAIVATFADGYQAYEVNLDETIKGNQRLTKAVLFGIHKFPVLKVQVE